MKTLKNNSLAVCMAMALPALALPLVSHAARAAPASAVQDCSRALAASLGTRLAGDHYVPAPMVEPYSQYAPRNQLVLTARSALDHRVVAEAICNYNDAGVVSLTRDPLDALDSSTPAS